MRYICRVEPHSELMLCLVGHCANPGEEFSEFRTGLDHLELLVDRRDDLHEWARRLTSSGSHTRMSRNSTTPRMRC